MTQKIKTVEQTKMIKANTLVNSSDMTAGTSITITSHTPGMFNKTLLTVNANITLGTAGGAASYCSGQKILTFPIGVIKSWGAIIAPIYVSEAGESGVPTFMLGSSVASGAFKASDEVIGGNATSTAALIGNALNRTMMGFAYGRVNSAVNGVTDVTGAVTTHEAGINLINGSSSAAELYFNFALAFAAAKFFKLRTGSTITLFWSLLA